MLESASKYKSNIPTCSICKYEYDSYYRIPRVIPRCGHTFCQKCINLSVQVRANRKVFICTQCESETVIRKGAADDIPKNIGILDVAKNLKKLQYEQSSPMSHKSPGKDSPSKQKQFCKEHPSKQLDLVCQTCNFQKVCSICALMSSSHYQHKFVEYIPASKFDLNEVKEVFVIIEDTVKQTILPNAKQNIIKKTQENLINQLIGSVKDHFKENYYKIIEKKQIQLIAQVKQIKFEGGISKKIQQIAKTYDLLKIQYVDIFRKSIEKQNTALQIVQEFIQKCKSLHNQVQFFSQHAQKQSKSLFKDISIKINQSTFFRITQMSFSLKSLLTQKFEVTSPQKFRIDSSHTKKRSVDYGMKLSGRGQRSNSKCQDDNKSIKNMSFDGERKPFTASSITNKRSGFMPPKHNINKSQAKFQKKDDDIIPILLLDSKIQEKKSSASQSKPSSSSMSKLNNSSFENINQVRKSVEKYKQSASKLNYSQITKCQPRSQEQSLVDSQQLKIKQVRTVKQIPLNLKAKFSAITKQISRQAQGQSLELIGMQINDSLIVYVCDYLKSKKLKFSMIKLVKNTLTDEGLSILLGYLVNDDRIQVLNLTSNLLSAKALDLFMEVAAKNNFLKTIYLSHNKISSMNVKQKAKQLQNLGLEIII